MSFQVIGLCVSLLALSVMFVMPGYMTAEACKFQARGNFHLVDLYFFRLLGGLKSEVNGNRKIIFHNIRM